MSESDSARLDLTGPVVMDTVNDLLPRGTAALARGDLTVNFSGVTDIDSSALALILQWQRDAETSKRRLHLEAVPSNLNVLADLYGISSLLGHSRTIS